MHELFTVYIQFNEAGESKLSVDLNPVVFAGQPDDDVRKTVRKVVSDLDRLLEDAPFILDEDEPEDEE